jgi:tetratricopeptide (TPR) repeat protein
MSQSVSSRAAARLRAQGNYTEALKDFRAVADTHASTSVADNALLEIARYYLDVINDTKQATTAVEAILTKYPTSDSAPDAYVMAGRLALSRGHQPVDLEAAIANFDRVFRLFPNSDAVPRSLLYAGETHWYARRYDDALASFGRVTADYPTSASAADSYLGAGRVLVSLGRPVLAMEELQQIRNRWPELAGGRDRALAHHAAEPPVRARPQPGRVHADHRNPRSAQAPERGRARGHDEWRHLPRDRDGHHAALGAGGRQGAGLGAAARPRARQRRQPRRHREQRRPIGQR